MNDRKKTKDQLILELQELRRRMADLEEPFPAGDRANAAGQEEELSIRTISDNLQPGMIYQVIRDPNGSRRFTFLSDTVQRFYGITPQEGLADASLIYGKFHEEDRQRVFNEEEQANRTLTPFKSEVRMTAPTGGIRWSLFISHPRRLTDGSTCWDGIEFDITDQKKAEITLRESEETLSKIFRIIPIPVCVIRLSDGIFLDINKSFARITGYARKEVVDHPYFSKHPNVWVNQKDRLRLVKALRSAGEVHSFETLFRGKGGELICGLISARVLDINGEACVVGIVNDITEQNQVKEVLERSGERLRALSARLQSVREEERANMAREIHDDLGQLLTGLKMDVSWILRHPNSKKAELREKALGMGQLIDQTVQTVRRISTELRPRILDDFGLVAALEWQAEEFTKKTGIVCLFQPNVPQLALYPDLSIAVFRIFQEALTNVVRHSGATEVKASFKKSPQGLTLVISDDGRGILKEEIANPHSLGLLGMRERALIFGGTIAITGKKGKGTTVTLRLPVKK